MLRAAALTLAFVLLLAADAAAAREGTVTFLPVASGADLTVRGSAGYRVNVSGNGRSVRIYVSRGNAITEYRTTGSVSAAGDIDAGFGRFGRIALEFHPRGKVEHIQPFPGCRGNPQVIRQGVFVGMLRFSGEGGYTRVRARRARGTFTSGGRWTCGDGRGGAKEPGSEDGGEGEITISASCGPVAFGAIGGRPREQGKPVFPDDGGATVFLAASTESRGRVQINRIALAIAGGGGFLFDEALTTATVKPPGPFHGSAELQTDSSGEARWTGTLAVSFPGWRAKLAGPGFDARLARDGNLPEFTPKNAPCPAAG